MLLKIKVSEHRQTASVNEVKQLCKGIGEVTMKEHCAEMCFSDCVTK